jgi:hypothetical protein
MIALALSSATWFGYELTTVFTSKRWDFLLRFFSGFPIGVVYQSFLALVLQFYIPWGGLHLSLVLGIVSSLALALHVVNCRVRHRNRLELRVVDIVSLVVSGGFLVYRLHLVYFEEGVYSRGSGYSDFSFHLGLISSIAVGCNVNRTSLFVSANTPLAYPIFVNFHSAFLFADCDVSYPNALRWSASYTRSTL